MPETEMNPPWTLCEVHVQHTDSDCEYCDTQLTGQNEYLDSLQEESQKLNRSLAQKNDGVPFIETQPVVAVLMVQTIADMIFQDPKARMAFEINFHNRLVQQMKVVEQQSIRSQLLGGMNGVRPDQLRKR